MVAYLFRMPAGIPGESTRGWQSTIEPNIVTPLGTTGAPTAYGVPMMVDQTAGNVGNMRTLVAGDTFVQGIVPYGVLVRAFPTGGSQDPLGTSTPPSSGTIDIMRRGYVNVLLSGTQAAVKGGQVYIWTAAASGAHITGGWEAASPGGSGIAVVGSVFMGPADAGGITEIAFNL
jgi:hypothetical protein